MAQEDSFSGLIAYRKKEITDEDLFGKGSIPTKKKADAAGPVVKPKKEKEQVKIERVRCGCSGVEHTYFSNCMGCGRILCIKEGEGPCFHCETFVFSPSDMDKIPIEYLEDPEFIKALELRDRLIALDEDLANKTLKVHDLRNDWFHEIHNLYSDNNEYARQQYYKEIREKRLEAGM